MERASSRQHLSQPVARAQSPECLEVQQVEFQLLMAPQSYAAIWAMLNWRCSKCTAILFAYGCSYSACVRSSAAIAQPLLIPHHRQLAHLCNSKPTLLHCICDAASSYSATLHAMPNLPNSTGTHIIPMQAAEPCQCLQNCDGRHV